MASKAKPVVQQCKVTHGYLDGKASLVVPELQEAGGCWGGVQGG